MLRLLRTVSLIAVALFSVATTAQEQYQEGVHYELIEPTSTLASATKSLFLSFSRTAVDTASISSRFWSLSRHAARGVVVQRIPLFGITTLA